MCGICGRIARRPQSDASTVRRMQAALRHRGPDGEGYFADNGVELAMRRLSIIDLEGGAQPLTNEEGRVVLVLNGEIYNHVELRRELERRGHRFASRSDAEVLVHLYEDEGEAAVHRLRGMFAFALWDKFARRLLLGRDRMGEKPLYLVESDGEIVFASELKALVKAGAAPLDLDFAAVNRYFHYNYVPEPQTILKGVRKLPPGSLLSIDVDPWRIAERRYWRMLDAPLVDADPPTAIRDELERIAQLIVRADVPVGVALSGGLDSSAVAALVAREAPGEIRAFCVGYPHRPAYDERAAAAALAASLGMPLQEVVVSVEDMTADFPDMVAHRDDPIADIAGQGYLAVARAARAANVPVLLQGQGGDELFWGYALTRQGLDESRRRPSNPVRLFENAPDFAAAPAELSSYASAEFLVAIDPHDPSRAYCTPPANGRLDLHMTERICSIFLLENGLAQSDRLGMACAVETRLPFVDYRLVELVIGLRKLRCDNALPPKAWLRDAVADLLPAEVLGRAKQGFSPPLRTWHAALFRAYGDTLRGGRLVDAGILSSTGAELLQAGPFPDGAIAPFSFKALVLETWLRSMEAIAPASRPVATKNIAMSVPHEEYALR